MNKIITNILLFLMFVGVLATTGYAIFTVGNLLLIPEMLRESVAYLAPRTPLIFHALFGSIALFTGALQLVSKFRTTFPKANIFLRRIYYVSVIVSGVFGLYIALFAQGGLVNKIGFAMLAVLWLGSIGKAIQADIKGDMAAFRIWIVRNYALTLASVTLRLYIPIMWSFYGFSPDAFDTVYATLGFLCWVPNVLFVEWYYLNRAKSTSLNIASEAQKLSPREDSKSQVIT